MLASLPCLPRVPFRPGPRSRQKEVVIGTGLGQLEALVADLLIELTSLGLVRRWRGTAGSFWLHQHRAHHHPGNIPRWRRSAWTARVPRLASRHGIFFGCPGRAPRASTWACCSRRWSDIEGGFGTHRLRCVVRLVVAVVVISLMLLIGAGLVRRSPRGRGRHAARLRAGGSSRRPGGTGLEDRVSATNRWPIRPFGDALAALPCDQACIVATLHLVSRLGSINVEGWIPAPVRSCRSITVV